MDNYGKDRILDILSTCMIRHEIDTRCKDCIYYGKDCADAHKYAYRAVNALKQSEVINGKLEHAGAGSRISYRRSDDKI